MIIEKINKSNYAQALEVYKASWRESHRDVCSEEFLERRDYDGYLRSRMDSLYVIADGVIVGVFTLNGNTFGDLYIHPQKQEMGYGTACIRYAKTKIDSLRLTVLSGNLAAIRLYQREGFQFTGNEIPLKNGIRECEMIFCR